MAKNISPRETKAVGWYALWWTQVTDWYKHAHKRKNSSDNVRASESRTQQRIEKFAAEKEDSTPVMSYARHAMEETERPAISAVESKRLETAVEESHNTLVKANTVFPFTLFPTTVAIDRHKLTLIYRLFFKIEQTVSVPMENIKNIQANLGPFFGSITITSDHFVNNTQTINYLWRKDAIKIQKMVQGAMVAASEDINVSKVPAKKLRKWLEDLGGAHSLH